MALLHNDEEADGATVSVAGFPFVELGVLALDALVTQFLFRRQLKAVVRDAAGAQSPSGAIALSPGASALDCALAHRLADLAEQDEW